MSEPYNQLLLAPGEGQFVAALEQASQRSGLDRRGPEHWRPLLDEIVENAEGRSQMEHRTPGQYGSRYVVVAWWSDHQGRKFVRVAGGDTSIYDEAAHPHFSRLDHDLRPPLWHIAPHRVYQVKRGDEGPLWLVCCGCGETGKPAALAWMGDCCGPCHDRREEGVAAIEVAPATSYNTWTTIFGLAVAPSGQQIACSIDDRRVLLIDLAERSHQTLCRGDNSFEFEQFRPLLFSPDGDFLAAGDSREMRVRLWHRADSNEFDLAVADGETITGLAFSPNSHFLAACSDSGTMTVSRRQDQDWHEVFTQPSGVTSLAFSPDSHTLALGGSQGMIRLLSVGNWAEQGKITTGAMGDEDVLWLEYLPGGKYLLMLTGSTDPDRGRERWQLRLWDLARKREERYAHLWPAYSVALSPDGRYLAWIHRDEQHSPAAVSFWDVHAWKQAGWLESDSEDELRELVFSHDGRTLVTGSERGVVKLIPWRLLLGV